MCSTSESSWLGSYSTIIYDTPRHYGAVPNRVDAWKTAQDTWTCLNLTSAIELEHTRSSRRESMMFTHKHGSSSLGHRSTSRALAKGCHGSLGSSKSPSTQCLTLLSWKMAAYFANMCNVIHGSLESLHSYITTISWDGWLPHHRDTITANPPPATTWQSLCHSSQPHKSPDRYGVTVRHWLMGEEM